LIVTRILPTVPAVPPVLSVGLVKMDMHSTMDAAKKLIIRMYSVNLASIFLVMMIRLLLMWTVGMTVYKDAGATPVVTIDCGPSITNCASCISSTVCGTCEDGYALSNGRCEEEDNRTIRCKAGYPTLGTITDPNLPDTTCGGASFENVCYVMYTDYHDYDLDAWTYGCLLKGSLDQCNQSHEASGVTNHYCCCESAGCNDRDFAENCGN